MNNSWAQSNRRVTDLHTGIWSECARVRGSDDESARARARTCICSSLEMRVDAVVDLSVWGNVKKRVDEEKRRGFMMEGINDPRRRRRRISFRLWGAFLIWNMSDENNTTLSRTSLPRYWRSHLHKHDQEQISEHTVRNMSVCADDDESWQAFSDDDDDDEFIMNLWVSVVFFNK